MIFVFSLFILVELFTIDYLIREKQYTVTYSPDMLYRSPFGAGKNSK